MLKFIQNSIDSLVDFLSLFNESIYHLIAPPFRKKNFIRQLYFITYKSAPLVLLFSVFIAIITIYESSYHMKLIIHSDFMVPAAASLLLLKEVGPVISAIILANRVGTGWAAEIATMKTTDQIDALKLLDIEPIKYLSSPRLLAGIIGTPVLSLFAAFSSLIISMLIANVILDFSINTFISSFRIFIHIEDIFLILTKGLAFGIIIPMVAVHSGLRSKKGAQGVGNATTKALIRTIILIIIFDLIINWFFIMI